MPARCQRSDRYLALNSTRLPLAFTGVASERVHQALARLTDIDIVDAQSSAGPKIEFHIGAVSPRYPGLEEDESYHLQITGTGVRVAAAGEFGALRAIATFGQLLDDSLQLPCVEIEDAPRFSWRGLLLDPARHFLELPALLRTLDGMAACKLNVLHLHLSDDQGFRLPSSAFPELPSARHYSADELHQLVDHAAALGIRIVPELDMPGHVNCWLTAYPQWGSQQTSATDRFGVHPACLDPTSEEVYQAVETLLEELAGWFPDPCIHIGGDEVHPDWWSSDERIGQFMRQRGMSRVADLQAHFNHRVGALVEKLGKRVVAWDEVVHDQLPADWIVQAWRGATSRDRVRSLGNPVLMSAPYYLDLHYSAESHYRFDPGAPQSELIEREDALTEDPRFAHVAGGMRWTRQWRKDAVQLSMPESESALLGGEACLWGELVDGSVLDQRLWSRLPAVAELFWSSRSGQDADSLVARLQRFRRADLRRCGIDLDAQLEQRLSALGINSDWQELASLVEPVKWYGRLLGEQALAARLAGAEMPQARPYGTSTPLNKLADVLPPASEVWSRLLGDIASSPEPNALAGVFQRWSDQCAAPAPPAALQPLLPAIRQLADLALARLEGHGADAEALNEIIRPRGELMIALPEPMLRWLSGE